MSGIDWAVWGPPLGVMLVAVVVGAVLVRFLGADAVDTQDADLAERQRRADILLDELRALDADRAKLGEEAYTARREALLQEASQAMKEVDEVPDAPAPPTGGAPSPGGRGLGLAFGTLGLLGLLGVLLVQNTAPREAGQVMTGAPAQSKSPQAVELEAARAALEENPDDIEALNTVARDALLKRDVKAAMDIVDKVRALDEDNAQNTVHLAILQYSVGMRDRAEVGVDKALALDPTLEDGILWKGILRLGADDTEAAVAQFESLLAKADARPDVRRAAEYYLDQATAPPVVDRVGGTVVAAEGVSVPDGALLFIIARRSEAQAGPPVAALRVPIKGLPHAFTLTDANMMLGGEWPEEVWLSARVDSDGDPLTKDPADPTSAVVGPIASGATGLEVVLGAPEGG